MKTYVYDPTIFWNIINHSLNKFATSLRRLIPFLLCSQCPLKFDQLLMTKEDTILNQLFWLDGMYVSELSRRVIDKVALQKVDKFSPKTTTHNYSFKKSFF